MKKFLKTQQIDLEGQSLEIRQLSGLDRFDFLEYCSNLPTPERPIELGDDATPAEQEQFQLALNKYLHGWQRFTFTAQCRLVAVGLVDPDFSEDLNQRHQEIMSCLSMEQAKTLHDAVADFSGMSVPVPEEPADEPEIQAEVVTESVDPK